MMDREQAEFFKAQCLPLIRECSDLSEDRPHEPNPLRPMLRQVLGYVDYLEAAVAEAKQRQ